MEQKQQAPYPLRMPPEMRSHYEDLAEAAGRSLNAEIVAGLQELQSLRDRLESFRHEVVELRENYYQSQERITVAKMELVKLQARAGEGAVLMKHYELMNRGLAQFLVTLATVSRPLPGMEDLHKHFEQVGRDLVARSELDDDSQDPVADFLSATERIRAELDRTRQAAIEAIAAREKRKNPAHSAVDAETEPLGLPEAVRQDVKATNIIRRTRKPKT